MSAEKPLLHIRNLSVTYMAANPPVTAVSDISLQVKQGEEFGDNRGIGVWKIYSGFIHYEAA
ncbi:hypothetical protein SSCH_540010 [Syntrophaceticus schinkii]|uniref:Uncharacterized protein n=1 Tax=Syntrophaceticus schinkii TaxID=499207 RepID=A0A0B7MPI1_9FIRM|nr:hypothetical protein SSCH_540010 [Syntrophaceticus schinkii]